MIVATQKNKNSVVVRPPVVVVLGHVDHGKTTLLDFIRKTRVAEKESGGITQHIGAYQIEYDGKLITFIDTPGHEAFDKMRSRGAKVADVALLVTDTSEGVKEQTKEAIAHAKEAGIPIIAVLNKIDLPSAQPDWAKQELNKAGVILEEFGGNTPAVLVSAKTGQGIDDLLQVILLVAEIQELKADISKPASGIVLEAHLDDKRGPVATLLLKQGTLGVGDIIATRSVFGKVRSLEDFLGCSITERIGPSCPAVAVGFSAVPQVGDIFHQKEDLKQAQDILREGDERRKKTRQKEAGGQDQNQIQIPVLRLVLKADAQGSLEAIGSILKSIPQDKVKIEIIYSGLGLVGENDIELARGTKSSILAFKVKTGKTAQEIARRDKVQIINLEIIYQMVQKVRELMAKKLPKEVVREETGRIKILETFGRKKGRQIVGGRVSEGKVERGSYLELRRGKELAGEGKAVDLQRNRKPVREGGKGDEVGILYEGSGEVQKGDTIKAFKETKKQAEF